LDRWRRQALILVLKSALAAALIWLLIASGGLDWKVLSRVRFGETFFALVACRATAMVFPLLRWQRLVTALGLRLGPVQAVHIGLIGSFFGMFAPASLAQDTARLYYGARANEGFAHELVSTVLVDRIVGLVALMMLAVFWGGVLAASTGNELAAWVVLVLAGALGILLIAAAAALWRSPQITGFAYRWRALHRVLLSILRYRGRKRALAAAFVLSWISQSLVIACAWFGFRSLNEQVPALVVAGLTPMVSLSNGIPITPQGIGVADSVGEALFRVFGISSGAEAHLVVRFATLLISIACGLAYLLPVWAGRARPLPG
jgi:uncharacterized protein (TIRG00374 family)